MNWSLGQFEAYLLLCSANADFGESREEHRFIQKKVAAGVLESVQEEFANDSEFQRIEKLKAAAKSLSLTQEQLDRFVEEMKDLFQVDGTFDQMEKNFLMMTKHIIG